LLAADFADVWEDLPHQASGRSHAGSKSQHEISARLNTAGELQHCMWSRAGRHVIVYTVTVARSLKPKAEGFYRFLSSFKI
jgi:hypothetical protein